MHHPAHSSFYCMLLYGRSCRSPTKQRLKVERRLSVLCTTSWPGQGQRSAEGSISLACPFVARRLAWEDESSKFGAAYNVNDKAKVLCEVILRRAKAQFLTVPDGVHSSGDQPHSGAPGYVSFAASRGSCFTFQSFSDPGARQCLWVRASAKAKARAKVTVARGSLSPTLTSLSPTLTVESPASRRSARVHHFAYSAITLCSVLLGLARSFAFYVVVMTTLPLSAPNSLLAIDKVFSYAALVTHTVP